MLNHATVIYRCYLPFSKVLAGIDSIMVNGNEKNCRALMIVICNQLPFWAKTTIIFILVKTFRIPVLYTSALMPSLA